MFIHRTQSAPNKVYYRPNSHRFCWNFAYEFLLACIIGVRKRPQYNNFLILKQPTIARPPFISYISNMLSLRLWWSMRYLVTLDRDLSGVFSMLNSIIGFPYTWKSRCVRGHTPRLATIHHFTSAVSPYDPFAITFSMHGHENTM